MDIQVFGIKMVTVFFNLIVDLNCSIFSTHMVGIQIRAKGRTEYGRRGAPGAPTPSTPVRGLDNKKI